MRGKEQDQRHRRLHPGITPACAGKSRPITWATSWRRDHPRMCGEKYRHGYRSGTQGGSPPHVRGKEHQPPTHDRCPGITPVCAGKSAAFPTFSSLKKDHPRMCGEKNIWVVDAITSTGSPPHVRGKALLNSSKNLFSRITPACAGKRLKRSRSTVSPVAIVPLFPSVCNKPVVSDGSPAGRDAPLFLPAENAVPASPAYNLRSL